MTREELIRELVLVEISDDYENVDQIIFPHVSRDLACAEIKVERRDIVKALKTLVADGLATVHQLTVSPSPLLEVPSLEEIENDATGYDFYFWITDRGREHHERSKILKALFDDAVPPGPQAEVQLDGSLNEAIITAFKKYLRSAREPDESSIA